MRAAAAPSPRSPRRSTAAPLPFLLLLPALLFASLPSAASASCRFAASASASASASAAASSPAAAGAHFLEAETFDGFYNNLAAVSLGSADAPLLRLVPSAYADGVLAPSNPQGPNPRALSEKLMGGGSGSVSLRNRTVLLVHYGQHIVEEVVNAMPPHCTPE